MKKRAASFVPVFVLAACSTPPAATPDATVDAATPDASVLPAPVDVVTPADVVTPVEAATPDAHVPLPIITANHTRYVDPFIGTGGIGFGVGTAFPGPQRPFGLARPSPDTSVDGAMIGFMHCSGYAYGDPQIEAFSLTRLHGVGIVDYGAVGFMPVGSLTLARTTRAGHRSHYDKHTETAQAGYYGVTLTEDAIHVELTATSHVAVERYTFPAHGEHVVLVDVAHQIGDNDVTEAHVDLDASAREVSGYSHFVGGYSGHFGGMRLYFTARFSRPFVRHGTWSGTALTDDSNTADGMPGGAYVSFDATDATPVEVRIGVSFVDAAHARADLDAETPDGTTFDAVRAAADAEWERRLSVIDVQPQDEAQAKIFYTALYHAMLMPTNAQDSDGSYRGLDGRVHGDPGFRYYTDFSMWDTFRTEHPLLTLIAPDETRDMMKSLIQHGRDGGYIDRWPLGIGYTGGMVGDSAAVVIGDAWARGIHDFDLRAAYGFLRATATAPVPAGAPFDGRSGIADYVALGYVPDETEGRSVSKTQEYAYDDFALAGIAGALGETADHDTFLQRSHNWRNLYDPSQGFVVGRKRDGTFVGLSSPTVWNDLYAEGDAWHYLWYAPQDVDGLASVMGGRDAFLTRLDTFFATSRGERHTFVPPDHYWQGNEPDIHTAWLFSAMDDAARTSQNVQWIASTFYKNGPDGIPGNDDAGTMSAWYAFAAMGMFPIAGTDTFLLDAPLLARTVLHLAGGVTTTIESGTSMAWNGAALARPRIDQGRIVAGGTLTAGIAAR